MSRYRYTNLEPPPAAVASAPKLVPARSARHEVDANELYFRRDDTLSGGQTHRVATLAWRVYCSAGPYQAKRYVRRRRRSASTTDPDIEPSEACRCRLVARTEQNGGGGRLDDCGAV